MADKEWVIKTEMVQCCINLGTYSFVLGLSIHNIVQFMVI